MDKFPFFEFVQRGIPERPIAVMLHRPELLVVANEASCGNTPAPDNPPPKMHLV